MEGKILEVVFSGMAFKSLEQIHEYGIETFSLKSATVFLDELICEIESLNINYLIHPECRYLITKSGRYRNLIYGSYNIIYRITSEKIEVLNILHSSRSVSVVKASKKIRI